MSYILGCRESSLDESSFPPGLALYNKSCIWSFLITSLMIKAVYEHLFSSFVVPENLYQTFNKKPALCLFSPLYFVASFLFFDFYYFLLPDTYRKVW